jgi:tetratricopeptide (TPR) repeat protein
VLAALIALCAVTETNSVLAQSSNAALAEALYEQGRELMERREYEAACEKFRHSQKLDPAGGTLLNLSTCLENLGKFASAWSSYKEALAAARRDGRADRARFIEEHLTELQPKVSHVTLRVPESRRVAGLSVKLDGVELESAAWDIPMPIDPGLHRISASAPGKQPFEKEIRIGSVADTQVVEIPDLADDSSAVDSGTSTPAPAAQARTDVTSAASSSRTLGYVLGAVGIVGVGVGSYFGVRAFSEWDRRNELCSPRCSQEAVEAYEQAESAATISSIGIGVGLVAVAVGAYFVLSSSATAGEVAARPPRSVRGLFSVDAELGRAGGIVAVRSRF